MCTAATYKTRDFYFGRTLDNDYSYSEEVTVTPRSFPLAFRSGRVLKKHHAIIGTAYIAQGYPLYYDAVNEKGLCMAGLNFVGNAVYNNGDSAGEKVAQFELVPFILSQCATVEQAKSMLEKISITDEAFSKELPAAQLHWIIADRVQTITVETVAQGVRIYDNPVGVLTNNPPFDIQLFSLNNYMALSNHSAENRFSDSLKLEKYSRGMGAIGLPGDLSSQSRFVRAAFVKHNSISGESENESVSQFFHILGSVEQQRGCCVLDNGGLEITIYTSCCNADKGIYYYKTYDNSCINAVDMYRTDLNASSLYRYKHEATSRINMIN